MDSTEDLLDLVKEFPQAFALDGDPAGRGLQELTLQDDSCNQPKIQQLLKLINEFPDAFVDPGPAATLIDSLEAVEGAPVSEPVADNSVQVDSAQNTPDLRSLPPGYAEALRRRVQTLTWGQVDFDLVYGAEGLAEIWLVVAKSGTEIQSLCEAIARLINLLLLNQVPVPEIVRQIRGIRGADSEGLGPHRILGLADLIGKVLQEAPAHWGGTPARGRVAPGAALNNPGLTQQGVTSSTQALQESHSRLEAHEPPSVATNFSSHNGPLLDKILSSPVAGAVCPECGAELSQVNGCKGGACIVCGYSSCS